MRSSYFKRKSIDALLSEVASNDQHSLRKALTAFDITLIGIGAIIGAGIFTMIGEAVSGANTGSPAGPALILSFLVTAVACGFAALCYAEFASSIPISGSAYTYSYASLGELIAWIIGWDLIIEYAIGNVAVAISWSGYFSELIYNIAGWRIPAWLRTDYRTAIQQNIDMSAVPHLGNIPVIFNLPAATIVLAITALLIVGIKESTRFNNIMVAVKLLVLTLFIGIGVYFFDQQNYEPFAPSGWRGIHQGASTIFFAYIGFDAVSTVAEETKNPRRDIPLGIMLSLGICTLIYILVTAALTGMIPYTELGKHVTEPLTAALSYHQTPAWLTAIIALGSIFATTAVLLVFQMGQPRIFFAMSRDGLLPPYFARVHPRFRTPHVTTFWTGVVVALLAAVCNLDEVANLCNIGTLFAFVLVCAGVLVMRRDRSMLHRPKFKVRGGSLIPLLGIITCLFLMGGLEWMTWVRFGAWLLIGIAIYMLYGRKHSKLRSALHQGEQESDGQAEH